ncbi:unnamed protein product, partial [Ixodes pacificus]
MENLALLPPWRCLAMNSYQIRGPGGPPGRSQYHQRHQYEHRFPEHPGTRPRCASPPHGQYRQPTPPRGNHNNHQRDYYCTNRRRRSKSAERGHPESHRPRTSSFGENVRTSERRDYVRSSPVPRSRSRHADRARPPAMPYGRGRSRSRSRSRPCSPKQVVPGGGCMPFPQEFRPEPKKYSPPPKSPLFVPVRELPFEQAPPRFPSPQVQYREIPEERDIERRILDPTQIRVVRREGEGVRPLFDRQEIVAAPVDLREDCLRRVVAVVRPRWAPPSPPPPATRQSRTGPGSPPCCRGRSPSFEP